MSGRLCQQKRQARRHKLKCGALIPPPARLSQPQHVRLPNEVKCNPGRICPRARCGWDSPRSVSRPVSLLAVSRCRQMWVPDTFYHCRTR